MTSAVRIAPQRSAKPRAKTNARARMGPFIGRRDVLDKIANAFTAGERLVTVLGPPGMGKTRVAERYLELHAIEYADGGGAWFCDLTQATDERALVLAIASSIRGRTHAVMLADGDLRGEIAEMLAELGPTLLVLDNFEQLVAHASVIDSFCRAAPELSIVVTSRERLALSGEVVIELAPLACPARADGDDAVLASEAVQLFAARANAAGGAADADASVLADLVRRLDGIPLAIELAAARTRVMKPAELASRLAQRLDVLAAPRHADGRHATLASAIEWSWNLLEDEEQLALAACSVFAGSFTAAAAEAIAPPGKTSAMELVAALRDKSLVFATESGRLALYASIREFAANKLRERSARAEEETRARHARFYAEAVRPFNEARMFQGNAPDADLRIALMAEAENLLAAYAFLRERTSDAARSRGSDDAILAAELAVGITELQAAPAEDCAEALTWASAIPERARGEGSIASIRVRVLLARQLAYNSLGRFEESRRDLDEVLEKSDTAPGIRALTLVMRGIQLRYQGRAREAWESHEEAARAIDELVAKSSAGSFPRLETMNTACMGRLQCDFHDVALARRYNERARELGARASDTWMEGLPLANLAQLEQEEQDFPRAANLIEQALVRFRKTSEPHYVAVYESARGDIQFEWGHEDEARRSYEAAASFFKRFPTHRQTALLHAAAAALSARYGSFEEADSHLLRSKRAAARGESPIVRLASWAHGMSVELHRARAARDDARREALAKEAADALAKIEDGKSADAEIARASFDVRFALRMMKRALWGDATAHDVVAPGEGALLRIAPDTGWFEIEGKRRDLSRRGSLKKILRALVDAHVASPGSSLDRDTLLARGWPNERVQPEAASTRLRVAIATLRSLGLRDVLKTTDDGYALARDTRVEIKG